MLEDPFTKATDQARPLSSSLSVVLSYVTRPTYASRSLQHKTRKIYMLEGLEPSIALTGGPWYTDNELDTEFIQHLSGACLKFIRDLVRLHLCWSGSGPLALTDAPHFFLIEFPKTSRRS